jgi:hypothetical protein
MCPSGINDFPMTNSTHIEVRCFVSSAIYYTILLIGYVKESIILFSLL